MRTPQQSPRRYWVAPVVVVIFQIAIYVFMFWGLAVWGRR